MRPQHDGRLRPPPFGPTPPLTRSQPPTPAAPGSRAVRLVMLPGCGRKPDCGIVNQWFASAHAAHGHCAAAPLGERCSREDPQAAQDPRAAQAPPGNRARHPARPGDHPAVHPRGRPRRASIAPPAPRTAHRRSPRQASHHDGHHRDDHGGHRDADYDHPPVPGRQTLRPAFATNDTVVIIGLRPEPVSPQQDCKRLRVTLASIHAISNERSRDQKQPQRLMHAQGRHRPPRQKDPSGRGDYGGPRPVAQSPPASRPIAHLRPAFARSGSRPDVLNSSRTRALGTGGADKRKRGRRRMSELPPPPAARKVHLLSMSAS